MENENVYATVINVIESLSEVGVKKGGENKYDKYSYRGIDDLLEVLAKVLAEKGLILIPNVTEIKTVEAPTKNGVQNWTTLKVDYRIINRFSDEFVCTMYGEGTDRGDKSINKAITSAFKNLCFNLFAIPVGGVDSETESPEIAQQFTSTPEKKDCVRHHDRFNEIDALLTYPFCEYLGVKRKKLINYKIAEFESLEKKATTFHKSPELHIAKKEFYLTRGSFKDDEIEYLFPDGIDAFVQSASVDDLTNATLELKTIGEKKC